MHVYGFLSLQIRVWFPSEISQIGLSCGELMVRWHYCLQL